ncbi:MAG: putative toxin-antitoxin system toxin component, PIN family [Bacteroidales bacterium]|nr:putative toxin-antitoxin system toxin component, PIN family [Bacteroidales bacterium]
MKSNNLFILDTNIWISYLLGKQLQHLVRKCLEEGIEIITCRQLVEELDGVMKREKFRKYLSEDDIS